MTAAERQKRLRRASNAALIGAGCFYAVLIVGLAILCLRMAPTPDDASLNLAILAVSMVLGWLAGMLMSPSTSREERQFSVAAKAISTFVSGYLLAKFDNLLSGLLAPKVLLESTSMVPAFRIALCLAAGIGQAISVYAVRVYFLEAVPEPGAVPDEPK